MPDGFTVVSGALLLQAGGRSTGPLPCDSCSARLTIPISKTPSAAYDYICARVVDGQVYVDPAGISAGTARTATADSGAVVECSVNTAGSYVVGRALRAPTGPAQGVPGADTTGTAAKQPGSASVPSIVGGVVGGVVGAAVVAAGALFVAKRR